MSKSVYYPKLAAIMAGKGMDKHDIAGILGYHHETVRRKLRHELGGFSIDDAVLMAKFFGCSLNDIF